MKSQKKSRIKIIYFIIFLFFIGLFYSGDKRIFNINIKNKIISEFNENKETSSYSNNTLIARFNSDDYSLIESKYDIEINNLGNDFYSINYDSNNYSTEEMLSTLISDEKIEYVEPDYKFKMQSSPTSEPYYSEEWAFNNANYGINITNVWPNISSTEVVVAVIDTGINYNHPDLINKVWKNNQEIPNNGIDDDNNGYIDDYQGWNFYNNTKEVMDMMGHGTHIAGIIAGDLNGFGIVGMSQSVKIMGLNVSNQNGEYYLSDIVSAINYAVAKGVKIFNFSFGSTSYVQSFKDLMASIDGLFICAAGNGGEDEIGDNNDIIPFYPASYNLDNIVAVAAINSTGNITTFSNYGQTSVDIAAPGEYILSTYLNTTHVYMNGTSMATPFVTGLASILYGENPDITMLKIKELVLENGRTLLSLNNKVATNSIINVESSFDKLKSESVFPEGTGTIEDPYIIRTPNQIDAIRNNLSASYKLGGDINMAYDINGQNIYPDNIGFEPIATEPEPFTGTFDGSYYTIYNLTIKKSNTSNIGLFGYVTKPNNLEPCIYNLNIQANIEGSNYVGTLIGQGENINIKDITVTANITSQNSYIGGIVGYSTSSVISNSSFKGSISANQYVGGIAGYFEGDINTSFNEGNIKANDLSGGIVGEAHGNIEDVFNLGFLEGNSNINTFGGVVGIIDGTLNNSYNYGVFSINKESPTIGLIAGSSTDEIANSYYLNPYNYPNNNLGTLVDDITDTTIYNTFDFDNTWEFKSDYLIPTLKSVTFIPLASYNTNENITIKTDELNKTIDIINTPAVVTRKNYIFTSANSNIVTVDKKGLITPKSPGTATLTVYSPETNTSKNIIVEVKRIVKGDVNNDNNITTTDLVILRRHLAQLQTIPSIYFANADINSDGYITLTDLIKLRRYLAGLEEI